MSRIDNLKVFAEVVSARNFTSAAKRLGLTPSAVSKQISMLEERLGVRLLNRTTRAVSPTEAGQIYFERCRTILEELEEAESLIADMDRAPKGTLKIAAEPVFGRAILSRILYDYGRDFDEVTTELFLTDHSIELVKQGFDAGIHLGELDDPGLKAISFATHSVFLCASPQYLEEFGEPASEADLANHRLIKISNLDFPFPRQLDHYASLGIHGGFRLTVNDTDMAYQAAMTGIGIASLPNYMVNPQVQRGRLVQVLPSVTTESLPVQIVFPAHRPLSRKSQSFVDFLTNYFAAPRAARQD
ncbi:MAG: LysR family transcriptional regulator [Pseudomonadales bacterium]|nr:LysR family transcriptional regulator [Pseudomonadales bacterium]